jgi:hypothetical protein
MQLDEPQLVATKLNKLMIIFQYFSITLFSSKKDFVTNNSKEITPIYTLCKKKFKFKTTL